MSQSLEISLKILTATGQPYSLIPDSNYEDINIAVKSAKQAFESWSQTTKKQRSDLLMDLADKLMSILKN